MKLMGVFMAMGIGDTGPCGLIIRDVVNFSCQGPTLQLS